MRALFFTFFLLLAYGAAVAQPAINNQFFPRIGHVQTVTEVKPDGIGPGAAGPNQSWDFSTLQAIPGGLKTTIEHMSPGLTPYGDAFPDANVSGILTDTVEFFTYYKIDGNSWEWLGSGSEFGPLPFIDPLTILQPLAFGESFQDEAQLRYEFAGFEFHQYIQQEVRYRAYGDLILPQGTFRNVVLLENNQVEVDSFVFADEGFYSIDTIYTQSFLWMQAGAPGPLGSYSESNGVNKLVIEGEEPSYSTFGPEYDVSFDLDVVASVSGPGWQPLNSMALAPNPASGQAWLSFSAEERLPEATLQIRDVAGQLIRTEPIDIQQGENRYPVALDGLPQGLYLVSVAGQGFSQASRLMVR